MASTNLFTQAKVVPAKQAKAKVEKSTVEIEGLETYSAICAVEKALKALKETYKGAIETHIVDQFVIDGTRAKKRPANFKGSEGSATASCELRKRSSISGLNDEEIILLNKYGIETSVESNAVETFIINPAYKDDQAILGKVSEALGKVKGLPADFIQMQEATKKTIVTDASLDQVFALPEKAVRELIRVVGVLAVKPTLAGVDVREALESLKDVIAPEED